MRIRAPALPSTPGPALPCWRLILSGDTPNSLAAFSRASASLRPLTQYRPSGSCHSHSEGRGGASALPRPLPPAKTPGNHSSRRWASVQLRPSSHLPWGHGWVTDCDEVGWDAVAPPQLPGDAPVPAKGDGGESGRGGRCPGLCPAWPLAQSPPPRRGADAPDVVHPSMPRPLMGLREDVEVAPRHSGTGGLGHLPTAHVPLRPQQRLHHILGPAAGTHGSGDQVVSAPRTPSPSPPPPPAPSLTCRAAPPWGCPRCPGRVPAPSGPPAPPSWPQTWGGPGWETGPVTATPRYPIGSRPGRHTPGSLTRKGGGTLMRAPRESMMLMASNPCRCPTS